MKFFLIITFFALSTSLISQPYKVMYDAVKQTVGYNYLTNEQIVSSGHQLPGKIKNIIPISYHSGEFACFLEVKNTSYSVNPELLMIYNFEHNNAVKIREFRFSSAAYYNIINEDLIFGDYFKNYSRNIYTWKKNWKLNAPVISVHKNKQIGISYICETFSDEIHSFKCVDISSGESLWVEPLEHSTFMIRDLFSNDSSVFVLCSNSLTSYSYKNGKNWSIPIKCLPKQTYAYTNEDLIISAIGILSSYLTGFYFISLGSTYLYFTGSNMILSSGKIYLADSEKMKCIDINTGSLIWETELSFTEHSISKIIEHENEILLINYGFIGYKKKIVKKGKPLVFVFDKDTGKKKHIIEFDEKSKYISDYIIFNDLIYIKTNASYFCISLSNSEILSQKPNKDLNDSIKFKLPESFYTFSSDSMKFSPYKDQNILLWSVSSVYTCDSMLNILDTLPAQYLNIPVYTNKSFMVFQKDNDIYICDNNGKTIITLFGSNFELLYNKKIYFTNFNTLFSVKLD